MWVCVCESVAHFTGHASQTGGCGNSWHWTGKDWRLSMCPYRVNILFNYFSFLYLFGIKFASCSCSVISWRWCLTKAKDISLHFQVVKNMIQVQCQRREILLHQMNMDSNECQRNVRKKEKSSFVTAREQWPACWVSVGGSWGWRWQGLDCSSSVSSSPSFKLKYCPP